MPLAEAFGRAAELLGAARAPLVAGLGADVAGVRAAMALADRLGGIVDHLGSGALLANLRVLQDAGSFTTTLSEVRARADLLLVVGPDPRPAYPRLLERCFDGVPPLADDPGAGRRLLRLGPPADGAASADDATGLLPCPAAELPAAVAVLRALAGGRAPARTAVGGLPPEALGELAERLQAARYPVIAWAAGALGAPDGEPLVAALLELIRDLNRAGRCAGLPLGGDDNLVGANQVAAWQSGLPLRTGFARGFPEHDPLLFSAERLAAAGDADALVWTSAFRDVPPPATGIPTILLATPGAPPPGPPEVVIPVATPGVESAGQVFRMDGVVALPLRALRKSPLPSVAAALGGIEAALMDGDRVT